MKALLLGDTVATKFSKPFFEEENIPALFGDTLSLFDGNDINLVNLETAITESEKEIKKFGPAIKGPKQVASVLKKIGVNYCGLSNNHVFDFGKAGIKDTLEALDEAGLIYTGFGENYEDARKNLIVEKDGEKVCIIAVCEHEYSYALDNRMGSRPYDEYDTIKDIRDAKEKYDKVIVTYHGGKEYCQYPSPRLRKVCRAMADNGADIVLCQHSHCIGCYEKYNDTHIVYGEGNFHFVNPEYSKRRPIWKSSLAVKYDTKTNEIEFIPLVSNDTGIELAKGAEKEEIMSKFEKRNKELMTDEWKKGWRAFCEAVKENYIFAIKNACNDDLNKDEEKYEFGNAWFAHYLDCEAHSDVWRELFPTYNKTNELD